MSFCRESRMAFLALVFLGCLHMHPDFIKCEKQELMDTVLVELGDSLTLNCTYNCSAGFARGCWMTQGRKCEPRQPDREGFCTDSLPLQNISNVDLKEYHCNSEVSDTSPIQRKKERVVLLKLKDPTCCENNVVTHSTETTKLSLPSEPEDLSSTVTPKMEDRTVLVAVSISVALVLAALVIYFCLTRSKQGCNGKAVDHQPPLNVPKTPQTSSSTQTLSQGQTPKQAERVTLRIPTPEIEGDPEVPYADIVISVRGASIPDISQALYLNSVDRNRWWGAASGSHLQAARSADMLHVPQFREVTRKMSTNSEYAVIMYA